MKLSDITCTAKFAHLLGIYPKRAQTKDEEDAKKLKRAEDEEENDAEDESEDETAEDEKEDKDAEDEADEEKKSKKAKRAKAEDDKEDDAQARGRRLERARAQAIFESKAAGIRPDIAAQLAFKTSLSGKEAIALLTSIAESAPRRSTALSERMAAIPSPHVGVEGAESNGARTLATQILAAGKKARGEA